MRLGIFGGSFDPVHLGHLILAEQARDQGRLDEVRFVPAPEPPHKRGLIRATFSQRLEMLRLAVAGHAAFAVDPRELGRPGPSYTADTLAEFATAYPGAELVLLLGADSLADLPRWHQPERIVRYAELLVAPRGSGLAEPPRDLPAGARLHLLTDCPLIGISSNDIRARVSRRATIRYLLPRAVECFIEAHGLYKV